MPDLERDVEALFQKIVHRCCVLFLHHSEHALVSVLALWVFAVADLIVF